jgi:hypothetical protein
MTMQSTGEMKKSMTVAGVAIVLAILAFLTAPSPATPDAFTDRGEQFFPGFDNPNEAASLEVVEFDEGVAEARPFKVTNHDGLWTIPSHNDYPADGEERLSKTAAGVIAIRKEDVRSSNVSDYEACGVVDPLDVASTSIKGRGKRVTIRGRNDQILADLIVGKELESRPGFRFVRLPEQKRIYVTKFDAEISSKFADWIEKDLLQIGKADIEQVFIKDYSIDERTFRVDQRDQVTLAKKDGEWSLERLPKGKEVNDDVVNDLLAALDDLKIVGVRPKPQGLSASLTEADDEGLSISQSDLISLQSRGFYFARDGSLLSNEGELEVLSTDGVWYTLRFGELVFGQDDEGPASGGGAAEGEGGSGENRYLFITTSFDSAMFPEPPKPAGMEFRDRKPEEWSDADRRNKELSDAHEAWEAKVRKGTELTAALNHRFARWYYVIPAEAYDKVHLTRAALVKDRS